MKKIITFLFLLPLWGLGGLYAQKELWGVNKGSENSVNDPAAYFGNITKYDIIGENPVIMHEFDLIHGAIPKGRLFLASNGKLYGTTIYGGETGHVVTLANAGVLFEYDLILNKYRVVHNFGSNPVGYSRPEIGVIEPSPGILVGAANNRIYKYDMVTESITFSNPLLSQNIVTGELMKASNGFIYGVSCGGYCQNVSLPDPYLGNIIKYDMVTNNVSFAHSITCPQRELKGAAPTTQLVEASPGKLYGTCVAGGINENNDPNNRKGGTLFEFNINTNAFTKKIDFNLVATGAYPINLVIGDNGKIYGLCQEFGIPPGNTSTDLTDFRGTLYEYTPATNAIVVKQYFGLNSFNSPTNLNNYVRRPTSLMRTSVGTFIGTIPNGGLFKWETSTNLITLPSGAGANNTYNNANLIEICRKPSYHEFPATAFTPCVNTPFSFDVQNTNATSYVWKKDTILLPAQTTAILNIPNLTITDTGTYTCTMTNVCGTTVTMPLQINVSCLGIDEIIGTKNDITLYPNPTKNILNIKLPNNKNFEIHKIAIVNLLGQTVFENVKNDSTIDVSTLQKGIYILNLKTNFGDWNGKFVKE